MPQLFETHCQEGHWWRNFVPSSGKCNEEKRTITDWLTWVISRLATHQLVASPIFINFLKKVAQELAKGAETFGEFGG